MPPGDTSERDFSHDSFSSLLSPPLSSVPATRFMAPKNACAKYQYVVTPTGPRIIPVNPTSLPKDEESPAEYNSGGYLPVKLRDSFKDGRYVVIRKLGYAFFTPSLRPLLQPNFIQLGTFFNRLAGERHSVRFHCINVPPSHSDSHPSPGQTSTQPSK